MSYQYIVLDSILNFEKDGEYAGFIDVNGKAYKEKAIRDDNLAGEILTSLLELVSAIFIPAAAGAVIGKLAASSVRIANFISKVSTTTSKVVNKIVSFAGKVGGEKLGYAAATITKGYIKGAADVGRAAIFGVPARLAKGDNPLEILKGYGIAILGSGSIRSIGTAAYDNFLFRRLKLDIATIDSHKNIKFFIQNRKYIISSYGLRNQFNKYTSKLLDDIISNNFGVDDYFWQLERKGILSGKDVIKILKLRRYGNTKFSSLQFRSRQGYLGGVETKSTNFLSSAVSDDIAKAILKGAEAQSLLKVGNQLTGVLKKYILIKILQLENTKLAKRLLTRIISLTNKKKDLIERVTKGIKRIKDKFYNLFNWERVKAIFDKKQLRIFKQIRESSYDYSSQAEKKTKEEIANDFLAKNQKLLLFNDSNKSEGGFGSAWLLGYKWITKYNKNTNEPEDTGSLRVYFKARIPKQRYKEKYVKLKKKNKTDPTVFQKRIVERKLFKAAITFKNVPFSIFEEMINSSSAGKYYWDNFAKQPKGINGGEGWKPRTYADIDFLMGQQNIAGIYGLQVKGLSEEVLKRSMGYSTTGQNILKFQGKTKEMISFIKNPLKNTTKTVSQNFKKLNMIKRTNR